jgi:hypothetical protein
MSRHNGMNYIETDPIWIALDLKQSLCGDRNSKYSRGSFYDGVTFSNIWL